MHFEKWDCPVVSGNYNRVVGKDLTSNNLTLKDE
jgi:hypothetical protein